MNAMKRVMALLLILTLAISCLPLGALTAFAAEIEDPQIPEGGATVPLETEPATEPETEPPTETEAPEETTDPTEATDPETQPVSESPTETTEPVPEETVAEEEPVEETTEPTQPTEPDKGPLMKSPGIDPKGGSSGSEVGGGGDGSGNTAGDGSSNMIAVGVTMQIVYYRYDDCYNRYNSHGSVISTVKNGQAKLLRQADERAWQDTCALLELHKVIE